MKLKQVDLRAQIIKILQANEHLAIKNGLTMTF